MPGYEITTPDGKKYRVEGPEGYTQEQAYRDLQGQLASQGQSLGPTRGGDLLRGLIHGAEGSLGGESPPPDMSNWRKAGETIGGVIPPVAAGFIPGGPLVKTGVGAATGALQPAKDWKERMENTAIGAGSAWGGGLIGKMPQRAKTALDTLAEMGIGSLLGHKTGVPWGGYGGLFAGPYVGRQLEKIFGGGLGDLIAAAARNPGLAAYLGIKASPYAEQAGQIVGQELGKPSE